MPLLFSKINRKKVMLLSLGVFSLCNVVSVFASTFEILVAARVIPAAFHPLYVSMAMALAQHTGDTPGAVSYTHLDVYKRQIWSNLRSAFEEQRELPIPQESVQNFLNLREGEHPQDYLFRNAPAVLCIQAPDPVDAGLAASAIEMVGTTLGIGVLYNGYLRRTIAAMEDIQAYLDMDLEEKPLVVCMLMGYSDVKYQRTAPRRNPSVVLR